MDAVNLRRIAATGAALAAATVMTLGVSTSVSAYGEWASPPPCGCHHTPAPSPTPPMAAPSLTPTPTPPPMAAPSVTPTPTPPPVPPKPGFPHTGLGAASR